MSYQYPQLSMGSADKNRNAQLQALLNEKSGAGLDTDGIFGPKTSQAVKNYQKQNGLQVDGVVGPKTWASLLADNSAATTRPGENGTTLPDRTEDFKDIMASAKDAYENNKEFSFDDKALLDQAAKAYLQRDAFSYNLQADPLYQQYAAQYIRTGRQAMEDTMGMAAAMTGGYGNSYAQTAGQQAYGSYLQQLNDRIPELYELAYSKYEKEGDRLRDRYAMLQELENQAYNRHQDRLERSDALRKEDYEKAKDEWNTLVSLIQSGYIPTDLELRKVGMTRQQANALMFSDL